MKVVGPADWKVTPWRSGQGETAEIAVYPESGDLGAAAFDWRVSLATMGEDADFSAFPGFERILTVVAGDGLTLDAGPDEPCVEAGPLSPVAFPGERKVTGRLKAGPVKNLNLMMARERARGQVRVLSLAGCEQVVSGEASGLVLFSLGPELLGPETLAVKDRISGACYHLGVWEALLQCNASEVAFDLEVQGETQGKLVFLQISPVQG